MNKKATVSKPMEKTTDKPVAKAGGKPGAKTIPKKSIWAPDTVAVRGTQEESCFLITINSQMNEYQLSKEEYKELLDEWYNQIENDILFVNTDVTKNSSDFIDSIDVIHKFEVGQNKLRCHSHSILTILHKTKIRLDYNSIREFFESSLGQKIHFDCQFIKSGKAYALRYLEK